MQNPVEKPNGVSSNKNAEKKKQTKLGIEVSREENFSKWYRQVIVKTELIDYYDVSGCYILMPYSYTIWEYIVDFFDKEIKKQGVKNAYFPLFVSKSSLTREKEHIDDFSPEVAWVTHSGDSALAEPIAIRPTSETVMYPAFARWIKSYRDLPLKLNQWNNVVRWEFKDPMPFLRTREFLWQEGHSAFATEKEADDEVDTILDLYRRVYEELLAVPVIPGRKTDKEKFAGANYTKTIESYIGASGRGIQCATAHHLGQNFSKMFKIDFQDPIDGSTTYVYQNSWGLTTRTIGVMVMVHSDDKGLILPPRVAPVQIVIIPCGLTGNVQESVHTNVMELARTVLNTLTRAGLRVELDDCDHRTTGWKFSQHELRGVPLRIEIGPTEAASRNLVLVARNSSVRQKLPFNDFDDGCIYEIKDILEKIQCSLFQRAKRNLEEMIFCTTDWKTFKESFDLKKIVAAPFCCGDSCESYIKENTETIEIVDENMKSTAMGAKSLCIPFDQERYGKIDDNSKCINEQCTRKPQSYVLFGRSY